MLLSGRYEAERRYNKWWAGKMVRLTNREEEFRRCLRVDVSGPSSFVYGCAYLVWEDGSYTAIIPCDGTNAFRPRKKDVEIMEENHIEGSP